MCSIAFSTHLLCGTRLPPLFGLLTHPLLLSPQLSKVGLLVICEDTQVVLFAVLVRMGLASDGRAHCAEASARGQRCLMNDNDITYIYEEGEKTI